MKPKNYFVILLSILLLLTIPAITVQAKMVSIKGDNINMRSGPGTSYKILWKLGSGYPLQILKQKGSWYRVQDFEGSIGWVHKMVTTPKRHMIVKANKNSQKRINVRSGPGLNSRIVAKAYYGVVFRTIQQKSGWVKVEHEKGVQGWIKRSLLWGF
ncbi:MAG: peptide-binding protein [Desulfobulbus propionicus]|nr:MAG: peptide-binding protein [Desulfobulbus propionicus]